MYYDYMRAVVCIKPDSLSYHSVYEERKYGSGVWECLESLEVNSHHKQTLVLLQLLHTGTELRNVNFDRSKEMGLIAYIHRTYQYESHHRDSLPQGLHHGGWLTAQRGYP